MSETEPEFFPNLKEPTGLYCFLNDRRPCDATCMAYIAPPEGPDYDNQQFANCLLLVNAHRCGKHVVVLAAHGNELMKKARVEAADLARIQQVPPPQVR